MMFVTTLFIAIFIISILYFFVIRYIPLPIPSYIIIVLSGLLCMFFGDAYFRYVGIEVLVLGSLVVWYHYKKIVPTYSSTTSTSEQKNSD
jgi:hypothetical protein